MLRKVVFLISLASTVSVLEAVITYKLEESDPSISMVSYYATISAYDNNNEIALVTINYPKSKVGKAVIDRIEVDQKYKGQGIGRELMNQAFAFLKQVPMKRVTWYAEADPGTDQQTLVQFYQSLGAKIIHQSPGATELEKILN